MKKASIFAFLILFGLVACSDDQYPNLQDGLYAEIKTNKGTMVVQLYYDKAPAAAANFVSLAEGNNPLADSIYNDKPYYDGITFHRIIKDFMIQGGDPTGTGMGGPGWWLPIENSSLPHDFGVISMARAGDPDSAGSQFFLCLSRQGTARLDGQYCAFGETIEGDDVIRAISTTPLADPSSGKPVNPPKIHTIRLEPPAPRNLHVGNQSKIAN